MPFTFSHTVIAFPLAKFLRLPLAPLSIGCMSPDLVRLLTNQSQISYLAHTWKGLFFPNYLIGILFCLAWYLLYRPVLYHFLKIHHPLQLKNVLDYVKFMLLSSVALLIGITTHITWDGLTHLDFRTFAFHQQLAQLIYIGTTDYPLHFILQISCSIIALPFIVYFCVSYYQQYKICYQYTHRDYIFVFLLILIPNGLGLFSLYQFFLAYHQLFSYQQLYFLIGYGFNIFSTSVILAYSLLSILFLYFQKIK